MWISSNETVLISSKTSLQIVIRIQLTKSQHCLRSLRVTKRDLLINAPDMSGTKRINLVGLSHAI